MEDLLSPFAAQAAALCALCPQCERSPSLEMKPLRHRTKATLGSQYYQSFENPYPHPPPHPPNPPTHCDFWTSVHFRMSVSVAFLQYQSWIRTRKNCEREYFYPLWFLARRLRILQIFFSLAITCTHARLQFVHCTHGCVWVKPTRLFACKCWRILSQNKKKKKGNAVK